MRLLCYSKLDLDRGIDPDRLADREQLAVVKQFTDEQMIRWLFITRETEFSGYFVRPDRNPYGFVLINKNGDCLIPDA